jgi:TPR repeat protein
MRAVALAGLMVITCGGAPPVKAQSPDEMCRAITDAQQRQSCFEKIKPKQALPVTAAPQKEQGPAVAACDSYAAAAVPLEQVNPGLAIPACADAVRQYPNSSRLIFELGRAYYKNNDFNSAAALYQQAAYQGFAAAEIGLGFLYDVGQGVPKDYAQAMLWYRKAADQGWSGAQYNVGVMYANGQGVAQDYSQAAAWYRKAADQGFAMAQNNLGMLYENGQGVAQDYQQALAWFRKAAEQGLKEAENNLASLKPKVETNEKLSNAKQQGYKSINFDDFKLDGKELAATNAKLVMQGFYKKFGDIETLQPTGLAVAIAREYGNDNGIPLLTDDASRNVRKFFLQCGDNPAVPLGCPLTVVGHAAMCKMTNLVGSKNVPCMAVEDGW